MITRNQHRADICLDSIFGILCHSKKLDITAHFFCIFNIFGCDLSDSLRIYIVKNNSGVKCHRGKDCYLTASIKTLNICSRICLCIAKLCCQIQCILKFHTILGHLSKNKVCGSIDDSHDFSHMIAGQTFFERTDSTCNRCLKKEIHMMCFCCIQKFLAMNSDQILVCRNYMLSCIQSG